MAVDLAVHSSLSLQILLYLNQWYYIFWLILEALCFIFKGQTLPYASNILAGEIVLFIALFLLDMFRIYFASKGNLTERNMGILISVVLTIPCAAGWFSKFILSLIRLHLLIYLFVYLYCI